MPRSLALPLHLYEVLEEEYRSLYNERIETAPETVWLQGAFVKAPLDYTFDDGHVKDPNRLYERLRDAKDALSQHLLWRLWKALSPSSPPPSVGADGEIALDDVLRLIGKYEAQPTDETQKEEKARYERAGRAVLNKLLGVRFYDADAFKYVKRGALMQELVELYDYENYPEKSDELTQFNRLLLEDVFPGSLRRVADVRLAGVYQRLHKGRAPKDKDNKEIPGGPRHRQAALCLSGGGIRSGSFALGLMQGLARRGLLKEFDYLSTVSGGGYIGGWLTAWIHRHREGLAGVERDLVNRDPQQRIDPDVPEIQYLRQYSNFITPQTGLLSADSWTFIGIYVRNLIINWLVFLPFVLAALYLPRLCVAFVRAQPGALDLCFWPLRPVTLFAGWHLWRFSLQKHIEWNNRHLFLALGLLSISWVILYMRLNRPGRTEDLKSRWLWLAERSTQRGFLKWCLPFLLAGGVLMTTYLAWAPDKKGGVDFLGFGLFAAVFAWAGAWIVLRRFNPLELVLLAAAGACGALLLWLGASQFLTPPTAGVDVDAAWTAELYVCFAVPLFLVIFLLGVTLFAAFTSEMTETFKDEDREWWARFGAWALLCALAWAAFSSLVIFGPLALVAAPRLLASVGGVSGLVAALVGRSSKTNAHGARGEKSALASLGGSLLPALATAFLTVAGAALSLLTSWAIKHWFSPLFSAETYWRFHAPASGGALHMRIVHESPLWFAAVFVAVLLVAGVLLSRVVNLNLFSLHAGYRNRLIRTFLGASRGERVRRPNPFTGFDPADNVYMHELRPALLREADFKDLKVFARVLRDSEEGKTPTQDDAGEGDAFAARQLYSLLDGETKDELRLFSGDAPPDQRLKVVLIEDLNRIIEEDTDLRAALAGEPRKTAPPGARDDDFARVHDNRKAFDDKLGRYAERSSYPPHRLFHVVNTSLNLVGGDNLAWQQRKAESFTVTPLHSGSSRVGYRRSKDYGGKDDGGISLGTAAAISGAAASSNMGYYTTSPVLSLVMTLFNVRLGWWLGNPGPAGGKTYKRAGLLVDYARKAWRAPRRALRAVFNPRARQSVEAEGDDRIYQLPSPLYSIQPVAAEAFGLTNDRSGYVYLTDGGHFENLALYEMVLRRCRLIVVADGAADADYQFDDLANAVRKIRIDTGVSIEFLDMPIRRKRSKRAGERTSYWAVGRIRYGDVDQICEKEGGKMKVCPADDGILIYVKPAVYGDEPPDILNYKKSFPDFPHESTADQFFDEPQFESHRMLGSYVMDQICEKMRKEGACDADGAAAAAAGASAPADDARRNEPDERARADFIVSACRDLRARIASPPAEREEDFAWLGKLLDELDARVAEIDSPLTSLF